MSKVQVRDWDLIQEQMHLRLFNIDAHRLWIMLQKIGKLPSKLFWQNMGMHHLISKWMNHLLGLEDNEMQIIHHRVHNILK